MFSCLFGRWIGRHARHQKSNVAEKIELDRVGGTGLTRLGQKRTGVRPSAQSEAGCADAELCKCGVRPSLGKKLCNSERGFLVWSP